MGAFLRKGSDARAAVAAAGGDLGMPSQEELLGALADGTCSRTGL